MPNPLLPTLGPASALEDWYTPEQGAYPNTTDGSAYPPNVPQAAYQAPPDIPANSQYSPSRNVWRAPDGRLIAAGDFRPLPRDRNTYDSNEFVGAALYPKTRLSDF